MLPVVIGSAVAALILFIILIVRIKKRKSREKEIKSRARDKMREEALDRIILNEKAEVKNLKAGSEKPFEVRYDTDSAKKEDGKKLMLRIEEISELSVRQYMLDPANSISIGSAKDNSIVISGIESIQCEIGKHDQMLYIRNTGAANSVVLLRKKKKVGVDRRKLELLNGDEIHIGAVKLRILFVKASE